MLRYVLSLACVLTILSAARAAEPDWAAILTPVTVKLPEPQEKVAWRGDLTAAMLEAKGGAEREIKYPLRGTE